MCDVNNVQIHGLTALTAKFIAETNDFLNRFWAHPSAGWPRKPLAGAEIEHPTLPGLVLQRRRLSSEADDGSQVYVMLVRAPEERPLPEADVLDRPDALVGTNIGALLPNKCRLTRDESPAAAVALAMALDD